MIGFLVAAVVFTAASFFFPAYVTAVVTWISAFNKPPA